ncbi:helix-turn-helix transcriptional regulator [Erwinia tasmaniensis]|uniref:TraA protein n=1 Tax=Erwinia tasmaniensis (strain DSM 17950 / CFBP 7177 / CIP 109463 / NCPPB 4357 / Et1/99) TaxID=465817 RepID=B2VAZ6_ERWT9|nr:LuxR C-terminal-related transcriptional regulator [Erwinia tasmaniensis]CAO94844.1 TraA protein [Erwinia tasmaniensis Et1/99]
MADRHHIPSEKLLKVFPELSSTESIIMVLYSLGVTAAAIAKNQNKSVKTVNNHLANIKLKLSTESTYDLRTLFYIRIMLRLVKSYSGEEVRVFSDLTVQQEDVLLLLTSGVSEREISYEKKMQDEEVSHLIIEASVKLCADDPSILKSLVCMKVMEHIMDTFS